MRRPWTVTVAVFLAGAAVLIEAVRGVSGLLGTSLADEVLTYWLTIVIGAAVLLGHAFRGQAWAWITLVLVCAWRGFTWVRFLRWQVAAVGSSILLGHHRVSGPDPRGCTRRQSVPWPRRRGYRPVPLARIRNAIVSRVPLGLAGSLASWTPPAVARGVGRVGHLSGQEPQLRRADHRPASVRRRRRLSRESHAQELAASPGIDVSMDAGRSDAVRPGLSRYDDRRPRARGTPLNGPTSRRSRRARPGKLDAPAAQRGR